MVDTYNTEDWVLQYRRRNDSEWTTWNFVNADSIDTAKREAARMLPRAESRTRLQFRLVKREARITDTVIIGDM